jgi:hypothetical protein
VSSEVRRRNSFVPGICSASRWLVWKKEGRLDRRQTGGAVLWFLRLTTRGLWCCTPGPQSGGPCLNFENGEGTQSDWWELSAAREVPRLSSSPCHCRRDSAQSRSLRESERSEMKDLSPATQTSPPLGSIRTDRWEFCRDSGPGDRGLGRLVIARGGRQRRRC